MKNSIEKFLNSISHIGACDDSVYDTLIKDEILDLITLQPKSKEFVLPASIVLSTDENTSKLKNSLTQLLSDYEISSTKNSLEGSLRMFVLNLPLNSKYGLMIDEIFGDYFDKPQKNKNLLYAPIRNFFYSGKCYILFMVTPPLITSLVAFFIYHKGINTGIFSIITIVIAFISMLLGIYAHDYLNQKIQNYEGVISAK